MDTAERTTIEPPSGSSTYDGFISYSHAADDLLAPRLQAGLQRFAKPWWKRRAVRIFRDESSLAANPHLWSSITEALDDSSWFVLLLSEDAASSEWVGKEIEHWIEHKPSDRILPVVTDGTFGWENGDVTGTSVPPALHGVFGEEPRWVDLRFARGETDLDLQNPDFSAAVADIAATIRGVPKDELASEEVKQHRRTVRTAWAAGITVTILALAAIVAGVFAIGQRNDARDNADLAEANAQIAQQNANLAETEAERANANAVAAQENAREADEQRAAAEREAAIARSRELSASAIAALDDDPELSVMLALESVAATPEGSTPSPEAVRTLRSSILANRLESRLPASDYARISPDGATVFHTRPDTTQVVATALESEGELWVSELATAGSLGRVQVSPDGAIVTVQAHRANDQEVFILDATTGVPITSLTPSEGCSGLDISDLSAVGGFSPGGQWFTVFTGEDGCGDEPGESWVAVYDTAIWDEVARLATEDGLALAAEFNTEGNLVLISSGQFSGVSELRSFPELNLRRAFENAWTPVALSPDGERIAYLDGLRGPIIAEAETGDIISSLGHAAEAFFYVEPFVFSPDGSKLLVAANGRDFVFNGSNGQYLGALGGTGPTVSGSFTEDGASLLTTTFGDALVWRFTTGRPIADDVFSGDWINPDQATEGPAAAVNVFDFEGPPQVLALLDSESGSLQTRRDGWGTQLPDGRFVVAPAEVVEDGYTVGPLQVWDPSDDTTTVLAGCSLLFAYDGTDSTPSCPNEAAFFGGGVLGDPFVAVADPGGGTFAAKSLDPSSSVVVWDQASLTMVSEFSIPGSQTLVAMTDTWIATREIDLTDTPDGAPVDRVSVYDLQGAVIGEIAGAPGVPFEGSVLFNADQSLLLVRDGSGTVSVYETDSWGLNLAWDAHAGRIRGWSLSDNGQSLATVGEDGELRIWDLVSVEAGEPPAAPDQTVPLPVGRLSDAVWISNDELMVFFIDRGTGAQSFPAYLDTAELVADARARLTRGFTDTECITYQIEDCPTTRAEIRSR